MTQDETTRSRVSSGAQWERIVGYSRAVRVGNQVFVAGTTSTDAAGNIVGKGDAAAQMRQALANIERALTRSGACMADVVRTRLFVTHIAQWESIGPVHGAGF